MELHLSNYSGNKFSEQEESHPECSPSATECIGNCVRPSDFQRGDHSGLLRKSEPTPLKNSAGITLKIHFIDIA